MKFSTRSISSQLILYFLIIGVSIILILGITIFQFSKNAIIDRSFEQLTSIRENKKLLLTDFFQAQINNITLLSESPDIVRAIQAYDHAYSYGVTSSDYDSVNAVFNPYLSQIKETYGLYDLFLVNTRGDIVYTVVHEPDFATNLYHGPYKNDNIADAFRTGLEKITLVDFANYSPSNGDPASFAAAPIKGDRHSSIGVLIVQLPLDKINAITQEQSGLGNTGETYLVGKDYIMRSNSRFTSEPTVLKLKVDTKAVQQALEGNSDTEIIKDYRNQTVLSSYTKINLHNIDYALLTEIDEEEVLAPVIQLRNIVVLIGFISTGIIMVIAWFISKRFSNPIEEISSTIESLSQGILPDNAIQDYHTNEINNMVSAINRLVTGFKNTSDFAYKVGSGDLDSSFTALSAHDTLGNALITMRDNLKVNAEEDRKRTWISEGMAHFSDITRNQHNIGELCNEFLSELIKYIDAIQGSIFIAEERENVETILNLVACYAYERKKFLSRKISLGEGLAGQAYLEKETIYLTEIPENYIFIKSGLGGANPTCIVIVPLKINDEVKGILEIASFHALAPYKIHFIENLAEHLASAISSAQINEQTRLLLLDTQQKAEIMGAQEEEMRQNMEELAATQEEMKRKEIEYLNKIRMLEDRPTSI